MPLVVTVSGTCSEVGKTGLVCDLLSRLPGWGAVKVTRGHYRSCGRDPETCCVSHLLGDAPRVFEDRADTDVAGKDTARYRQAGAAFVRWVVLKRGQEAAGARAALRGLERLPGVLIEGNRVAPLCRPDLAILVASADQREVKSSARRVLDRIDALYVPAGAVAADAVAGLVGRALPGVLRWGPAELDCVAADLRARAAGTRAAV